MRNGETLLAAAVIVLGTYALAWAATNVTNTTGTSTVGNAACFDNATATSIKDCGVQPNTAVTGSGYAVLQDSPVLTTVTTVRGNSATVPMNMDYNGVPSANYIIDQITGGGFNASSSDISYGQIQFIAASNTAGSEQGRVILQAKNSGAMQNEVALGGGVGIDGAAQQGYGTLDAATYYSNANAGVTCASGINATTFRSVGGIVTHC